MTVSFVPVSVTSARPSVNIAARLSSTSSVGERREGVINRFLPGLEAAIPSVEDETQLPPIATLILCKDKRKNSFDVERLKKTWSAATRPARSVDIEFEEQNTRGLGKV